MKALLGMWGLSFLLLSCVPFPAWGTTGTLIITTDTILTEILGYTANQIAELRQLKAV